MSILIGMICSYDTLDITHCLLKYPFVVEQLRALRGKIGTLFSQKTESYFLQISPDLFIRRGILRKKIYC